MRCRDNSLFIRLQKPRRKAGFFFADKTDCSHERTITEMKTRERFLELDLLRTAAVAMMIIFHTAFDLSAFYNVSIDPFSGGWLVLQRVTANLFLLLVGISFAVSYGRMEAKGASRQDMYRKYVKRGVLVLLCGMLVTLVTRIAIPDDYVRFGVLHLIGMGILILPFVMPLREGNLILAMLVFLMGYATGIAPDGLGIILLPLGWMPAGFRSADYFPLFPWLGTILLGVAMGNALYNRGWLRWHLRDNRLTRIITEPGRYALMIYLAHQPVLLSALWILLRN